MKKRLLLLLCLMLSAGSAIWAGAAERFQFWSYEVGGVQYSLSKDIDKEEELQNADGTPYYKSELTLTITKDGTEKTYLLDDELYLGEGLGNGITPCIAIDLDSRMMYIFTNSLAESWTYAMGGFIYISSLDDIRFQRETVFSRANWGWWPYFTYDNGTLSIQHFSFAGYYAMTSTRSDNGEWSTDYSYKIYPDEFDALWIEATPLLVIGEGSDNGYVDLGLPSGTLWATRNVGANSPEEYGDYFAWGETTPKNVYSWSTYNYCEGTEKTMTKYCTRSNYGYNGFTDDKAELEPEDDAATANWGSDWQMPTEAQQKELLEICSLKWTTFRGVKCILATGPNGGHIYLPAAGLYNDEDLRFTGERAYFLSRSLNTITPSKAYSLLFYTENSADKFQISSGYRLLGQTVRPVRVQDTPNPTLVTEITLSETSLTLYPDETKTLTVTVLPEDADNKEVTWLSSNESIATVDQTGKVTAVAAGSCTITCTAQDGSGVKAECQVEVIEEKAEGYPMETVKWDNVPEENREVIEQLFANMILVPQGENVKKFYISTHDVQKGLWESFMPKDEAPIDSIVIDSVLTGEVSVNDSASDTLKVSNASFSEIQEFISLLRKQTGKRFRLPTESEHQWAVRCQLIDTIADAAGKLGKGFYLALDTIGRSEPKMLVITTMDGTQSKYLLDEMPRVSIEKPYLVISAGRASVSFLLEKLQHMHYEKATDEATAIEEIVVLDEKPGREHIDFSNLPADANISIYPLDGKQLYSAKATQGKSLSLPLDALQSGIYLVKVNDVTYKIQKP